MDERRFDTRAAQAGLSAVPQTGPLLVPVYRTAPFAFETLAALDQLADGSVDGYEYSRSSNPTVRAFELAMRDLEDADDSLATASGMSAITSTILALCHAGDHVLVADNGYKRSLTFVRDNLPRWGMTGEWFSAADPVEALRLALRDTTRLVLVEVPSNPHLYVCDLPAVAQMCHAAGALLVVDATLSSPASLNALSYGADIVVHSCTKYISGHNDVMAGVICGSEDLIARIRALHTTLGAVLDPETAFLVLRGMKTLALRIARSSETASLLAAWLEQQAGVRRVYYPGLASHPNHALAKNLLRQMGGMFSVEFETDLVGVGHFVDALRYWRLATSLGGVESLVLHLGVLMRNGMTPGDRVRMGLSDQLVRFAVGIEDALDLQQDLSRGLAALAGYNRS